MASIKFPRKEFEKYVKLSKEVEEKISMLGTHLESANDEEVELEILPNRPDLFSLQGFMRAFLPFIGKAKAREYKIKKGNAKIIVDKSVEKIRPFSMAAIVKNIKFTDERIKEIMRWQEKIHATLGRDRKKIAFGYYVLDDIKFPVVYKAEEPKNIIFEPLDTLNSKEFDSSKTESFGSARNSEEFRHAQKPVVSDMPEKLNGLQILQRHPTGRAYAKQLEGFDKFPVYFDANNQVLSMPPIINSNSLGKINSETKNILVECSGTDLSLLKKAISMAVCDLIDMSGEAYSVEIVYGNKKESIDLKPEKIKLNVEEVNKLLGIELKEAEVKKLLEKMGHSYAKGTVEVPAYRTDIMHPVDLIEDIAIAYGYDNFQPEIPQVATVGKENSKEKFIKKVSEILAGLGMLENSSFHLITGEDAKKHGAKKLIEVEDSKTDYKFLRSDMLISSLKVLGNSSDAEYPQKIFEIGKVFNKDEKEETGIKESNHLVISISPGNFTEIKQILDYLSRMTNKEIKIEEAKNPSFIDGRCGKILHNEKEIGFLGELSPSLLSNWKIKMPVSSLELDIDEFMNQSSM